MSEFEARYFGQEVFWSLCDKCVNKQTYLQANKLLSVTQKVTQSEDMLAFAAILSVSEKCALLGGANYYYCLNPNSVTRVFDKQILERRESDLRFVLGRVEQLANTHYATHKKRAAQTLFTSTRPKPPTTHRPPPSQTLARKLGLPKAARNLPHKACTRF